MSEKNADSPDKWELSTGVDTDHWKWHTNSRIPVSWTDQHYQPLYLPAGLQDDYDFPFREEENCPFTASCSGHKKCA